MEFNKLKSTSLLVICIIFVLAATYSYLYLGIPLKEVLPVGILFGCGILVAVSNLFKSNNNSYDGKMGKFKMVIMSITSIVFGICSYLAAISVNVLSVKILFYFGVVFFGLGGIVAIIVSIKE